MPPNGNPKTNCMPCRMKTIPTVIRNRLSKYGDTFSAGLDDGCISSPLGVPNGSIKTNVPINVKCSIVDSIPLFVQSDANEYTGAKLQTKTEGQLMGGHR